MQHRGFRYGLVVAGALAFGGGAAAAALAGDAADPLESLDLAFPRVARRAQPSVVALVVEREEKPERALTQGEKMSLGLGAMRVFDHRYFTRPPGACTGVVVRASSAKTLVATAAWNVKDARSVSLLLADGSRRAAVVEGRDENLDVAILEVEGAPELPAIGLAERTRVGQYALLLGRGGEAARPILTVGNVSAVGRFKGDALQVSTRMNYGNVGGPVVDLDGNLLGIATRLTDRAHQGLNSGVGFAAPVTRILKELDALASGKVFPKRKSPFLGIKGDLKPLPEGITGVRIEQVLEGGAAKAAGIMDGDIIRIFNGVEVKDFMQLRDEIERLEVGERVIVTVHREEKGERDFTLQLGARQDGDE